ncbi:hypothetical protein CPC08DRAFT_711743 [Agrocybe pediades]|nr:hypothetical protein CPC08DRAFT_711743 [Agrocybe pediades]
MPCKERAGSSSSLLLIVFVNLHGLSMDTVLLMCAFSGWERRSSQTRTKGTTKDATCEVHVVGNSSQSCTRLITVCFECERVGVKGIVLFTVALEHSFNGHDFYLTNEDESYSNDRR